MASRNQLRLANLAAENMKTSEYLPSQQPLNTLSRQTDTPKTTHLLLISVRLPPSTRPRLCDSVVSPGEKVTLELLSRYKAPEKGNMPCRIGGEFEFGVTTTSISSHYSCDGIKTGRHSATYREDAAPSNNKYQRARYGQEPDPFCAVNHLRPRPANREQDCYQTLLLLTVEENSTT